MNSKSNLPALTGLRFFAAAAIFALHASQTPGFPTSKFAGFSLSHGVSFFYVLSGFILHYNYRDRQNISWLDFSFQRCARIWPLHIAALILALTLFWPDWASWYKVHLSPESGLGIIFLLHAWWPDNNVYFAINGPSWSISVELFFYLMFLPLSKIAKYSPLKVALGTIALVAIYIQITSSLMSAEAQAGGLYSVNPIFRLPEFVTGIIACEIWSRLKNTNTGKIRSTILEIICIFIVCFADKLTMQVVSIIKDSGAPIPYIAYTNVHWISPFFGFLIAIFASGNGLISSILGSRPLIFLGEISFAAYLFHQIIQRAVSAYVADFSSWEMLYLSLFITLAIATLAHYMIEKPLVRISKLWSNSNKNQKISALIKKT